MADHPDYDDNDNELVDALEPFASDVDDDDERDEDANLEGEDLDERLSDDYRQIPELDRYDTSELDNQEYSPMDLGARRELEEQLERRQDQGRFSRVNGSRQTPALAEALSSPSRLSDMPHHTAVDVSAAAAFDGDDDDDDFDSKFVNLDDFAGPLREWIMMDGPRREIRRRFRSVLTDYEDKSGNHLYAPRISAMCAENKQSLHVSYLHLSSAAPTLGIWLADCPSEMLALFDKEAYEVVLAMFPEYGRVHQGISVRITDLPVTDRLRDLRQMHLNALVRVTGVVTRRSSVFPQLQIVKYNCGRCASILGPFAVNTSGREGDLPKPSRCRHCDSNGPFSVNQDNTVYRNYQKLTLQESPGSVPAGRVPRTKDVILTDDLRDCARPGEEIDVTGVYANNFSASLNTQHGFPVFATLIEANYICKKSDAMHESQITEEDMRAIRELASQPDVARQIINSIAPSIYGHDEIKTAVAMALFGGQAKQSPNAHRIRGDINILLLGDPGTAKSQFLKYVEKTAGRCVYTTGKGASAVGLTASVRRDPMTREWTLEGGALVLADTGVCLIDEFDKMNEQDRTSIHEAMEQQSISISKAGIITTLQARCSVIAAANPIHGRYDSSSTFAENVELTDPILSRFDILCVVRDLVDPIHDERLATHVVESHIRSHPDAQTDPDQEQEAAPANPLIERVIPQQLLKKYIAYARENIHPRLTGVDQDKISKLYVEMRQQSLVAGGVPIAVRHVESMLRMAEAHAKMHLRDVVRQDDVDMAVRCMLSSFIGSQKFAVMNTLKARFHKYLNFQRSEDELVFFVLRQILEETIASEAEAGRHLDDVEDEVGDDDGREAETGHRRDEARRVEIPLAELRARVSTLGIHNLKPFFASKLFRENSFEVDQAADVIIRTL